MMSPGVIGRVQCKARCRRHSRDYGITARDIGEIWSALPAPQPLHPKSDELLNYTLGDDMLMDSCVMKIRLAKPSDAMPIAHMSRDYIERGLGWSWARARVAASIAHADTVVAVAADAARLHAFAIMYFGANHAHLNLLAVRPEVQRRGLGRGLLQWQEHSARVAGCFKVYLEVRAGNAAARRFYRTLGYHNVGFLPGYYRGREAAVRMTHNLRCTTSLSE